MEISHEHSMRACTDSVLRAGCSKNSGAGDAGEGLMVERRKALGCLGRRLQGLLGWGHWCLVGFLQLVLSWKLQQKLREMPVTSQTLGLCS